MESFRIIGISTGEPAMQGCLSSGGGKVPAGLKVRLVDVPAEVQADSAFETCLREQIEGLGKQFYPLTVAFGRSVALGYNTSQRAETSVSI